MRYDRATEIAKPREYGNFRDPNWRQKQPNKRANRPGNDLAHLANIRQLQCTVCPARGQFIQAHHLKFNAAAYERGVGQKASDRWAVPLCMAHHFDLEKLGSRREQGWWKERGFDAEALARGLWARRGDLSSMARVLLANQLSAIHTKGLRK